MPVDMNTDYAAEMNKQQTIMNSTTPGSAEYNAAKNAYNTAESNRNEKIAAMDAAGTNTNNYQKSYTYTDAPTTTTTKTTAANTPGSTTVTNAGAGDNAAAAQALADKMNANSKLWAGSTQSYLAQLIELEQWAANYNLDVASFQESIRQWEISMEEQIREFDAEFALSESSVTGYYNGTATMETKQNIASTALALLQSGIDIGDEQRAAIKSVYGMGGTQIDNILASAQVAAAGSGGGGGDGTYAPDMATNPIDYLVYYGYTDAEEAAAVLEKAGFDEAYADTLAQKAVDMSNTAKAELMEKYGYSLESNTGSILDLGLGPVSSDVVAGLLQNGTITREVGADGTWHYSKATTTTPTTTTTTTTTTPTATTPTTTTSYEDLNFWQKWLRDAGKDTTMSSANHTGV